MKVINGIYGAGEDVENHCRPNVNNRDEYRSLSVSGNVLPCLSRCLQARRQHGHGKSARPLPLPILCFNKNGPTQTESGRFTSQRRR